MKTQKSFSNGELYFKITGELDQHTADFLRAELDEEIETRKIKRLLLDFGEVAFMDSSGIGVIVGRYKKLFSLGGETVILNACKQVDKVLELSGIKKLIKCERGGKENE